MLRQFFGSLRTRLILLVILAVIPAIGLVWYTDTMHREHEKVDVRQDALELSRQIASQEQQLIQATHHILISLAYSQDVRAGDPDRCSAFLARLLHQYATYKNFGVADMQGNVFCSAVRPKSSVNIADLSYFHNAVATRDFAIGQFQVGRVTGQPGINFGYPVKDDAGRMVGVVYASLGPDQLIRSKGGISDQIQPGARLTEIDVSGKVLARFPEPQDWIGRSLPEMPQIAALLKQGEGFTEAPDPQNVNRLYTVASVASPLAGQDVFVVLDVPTSLAYAPTNRLLVQQMAGLGLVALLAIAAAWIGGDLFILRQVRGLAGAARRLAGGDLSPRARQRYAADELGNLERAFDQMAVSLQARQKEIEQTAQALRASNAEARQFAREMETINQVGQKLAASLNRDEIIELLGDEVLGLIRPGNLTIFLHDAANDEIEVPLDIDRGVRGESFRYPMGKGLVSEIITRKAPILTNDYLSACRQRGVEPLGDPARSWLGVPILADDHALGALVVWDYESNQSLTSRDQQVLSALAAQAAVAFENARLYGELQDSLVIQSKLFEASAGLTSQSELEEVLQNIVQSAQEAVGADQCSVLLIDEQGRCYQWIGVGYAEPLKPGQIRSNGNSVRVMRSGQALFIEDLRSMSDPNPSALDDGVRSAAGLPLLGKSGGQGAMWFNFRSPRSFPEMTRATLQTFANSAAIAVEQSRMLKETRQRLRELEVVNRVSVALRSAVTREEMLRRLLEEIVSVLDLSGASIWLHDPARDALQQVVARGVPRVTFEVQSGNGIAGKVFETGQTHLSDDFSTDPNTCPEVRVNLQAGLGGAAIPIQTTRETVGVLFGLIQRPRGLTPDEIRLLTTLAEMAGIAIHRMQLHQQTEQRLNHITSLHTIDAAISSSLDLGVTLSVVLNQAVIQLNADAADVLLYNEKSKYLRYITGWGFRSEASKGARLRLGESLAGRAGVRREIVSVPDLAKDPGAFNRVRLLEEEGFIGYHGVPLIAKGELKGVLEIFHRSRLTLSADQIEFLHSLALQAAIAVDNALLFEDLQRTNLELALAYDTTLEGWSSALDLRDQGTEGHSQRVVDLSMRIARAIGVPETELIHIRRGALLHDIGKMGIPDSILLKPGPLSEAEWSSMRMHPQYACDLLEHIPFLRPALDIPYCHHEKWDGTGYPRGLKGEQIPLAARIFAVVDVWDALRSDRPYRLAWSKERALAYLQSQAGKHFDPQIVGVFLSQVLPAIPDVY